MEWGLKKYVHVLIPRTLSVSLFGKRVFAAVIKDLERKSPWIRAGPGSNNM